MNTVSVIIVTYNAEQTLQESINSVLQQTYPDVECVVIDGMSTDNTMDIVNSYGEQVSSLSERDNGIYDAMNKGLKLAKGNWVMYLGADDILEPDAVESLILNSDDCDIVYGNTTLVYKNGEVKKQYSKEPKCLPNRMIACHQSFMMNKSVALILGGFDCQYKLVADYALMLKAYLNGYRFKQINNFISRFSLGGISTDNLNSPIEILRVHRLNKLTSNPYFIFIKSYIKILLLKIKRSVYR